jgi:hypothetical protein
MGGAVYTPFTGSGQNKNFVKRKDENNTTHPNIIKSIYMFLIEDL